MINQPDLRIENKAHQPSAADDFQFDAGYLEDYQNDGRIAEMRGLLGQVETVAKQKRDESAFYDRLESEMRNVLELLSGLQTRIKAGEFEQPKPQPTAQDEIEERHRAPF